MKHKTHKGMKKRIRVSGTGKFMRRRAHRSHYKLAKGSNSWSRLKRDVESSKGDSKKIRKLLSQMVRVRRSVSSRKSRKKILKQAKGYTGARSKRLRTAKEQVMHAGNDAFAHRKDKKATYRKIWISRINAASRQHGLSYSKFINGLTNAQVKVDRKILADLAINDPDGFKKLVDLAKENINA